MSIKWHQKEPLGCAVYSHCPTNDSCNNCIHGCCLSCNYVTGILQRVIRNQKVCISSFILTQERLIIFPLRKFEAYIWHTINSSYISWINKKFHCYHSLMKYLDIRKFTLTFSIKIRVRQIDFKWCPLSQRTTYVQFFQLIWHIQFWKFYA